MKGEVSGGWYGFAARPGFAKYVPTVAGEPEPVCSALEGTVGIAIDEIDLTGHRGEHPRIGAVDVVPFVPLGETTMADCVALARRFGARLGGRFGVPVYPYAWAAGRRGAFGVGPGRSVSRHASR